MPRLDGNCSDVVSRLRPYTVIPALSRHFGESRNPGILASWNANSYLASLDSGLRRNDGLRWREPRPPVLNSGAAVRAGATGPAQ